MRPHIRSTRRKVTVEQRAQVAAQCSSYSRYKVELELDLYLSTILHKCTPILCARPRRVPRLGLYVVVVPIRLRQASALAQCDHLESPLFRPRNNKWHEVLRCLLYRVMVEHDVA